MVDVPFICGVVFSDNAIVDIPAPDIGGGVFLSAWEGEGFGHDNGSKGKLDYEGNLWFIAVGGRDSDKYLVKVHWVSGTTFTVTFKQIPRVLYGEIEVILNPNQLTVDIDGNVYFPSGSVTGPTGFSHITMVKLSNTTDPDPNNWTYTVGDDDTVATNAIGTFGVALNPDHTKILTHVWTTNQEQFGDKWAVWDTATMTVDSHGGLQPGINNQGTFNIETDMSGGINDGYSYFILDNTGAPVLMLFKWGVGDIFGGFTHSEQEKVVAINTNGYVYTMERQTHCPTANPLSIYVPTTVGNVEYLTTVNMECVVPITLPPQGPGGTTPSMQAPIHHDILRTDNTVWPASGFNPTQGDVRRISDLSQICRARTTVGVTRYHYICTAGVREPYNSPLPPLPPVPGVIGTWVITPLAGRVVRAHYCATINCPDGTPLIVDWGDGSHTSDIINHNQCHDRFHTYTLAPGSSVTIRLTTLDGRLFIWNMFGNLTQDTVTILA